MEKLSLDDSSLKTDLGLCFCFGFGVLGLTRPCSSNISCCFLRRYSCFISSRRVFSSSLRRRSSSAFRLKEIKCVNLSSLFSGKINVSSTGSGKISYLASSRLSSDSASSCCLRRRASSAFFCCFSKNAALFLASSSSAFCSS